MFKNNSEKFINFKPDRWIKDIPEQFAILLSKYEDFRTELRNTLVDVRQGTRNPIEINNLIFDNRNLSLRKPAIDVFYNEVQQWLVKVKLLKRFNDDKMTYINVLDILQYQSIYLTFQDIDETLNDHFSTQYTAVILWYSSDRLYRKKKKEWEQIYQQLTLQQQQQATQQTSLIYIDFSQCSQKVEDFVIRRLPIQLSSDSRHNHHRGRVSIQLFYLFFLLSNPFSSYFDMFTNC
jgi:hypothetical protein